jgi:hypothetical protein
MPIIVPFRPLAPAAAGGSGSGGAMPIIVPFKPAGALGGLIGRVELRFGGGAATAGAAGAWGPAGTTGGAEPGRTGTGGATPSIVPLNEAGPGWGRADGASKNPQLGQTPAFSGVGEPHWGQSRMGSTTIPPPGSRAEATPFSPWTAPKPWPKPGACPMGQGARSCSRNASSRAWTSATVAS